MIKSSLGSKAVGGTPSLRVLAGLVYDLSSNYSSLSWMMLFVASSIKPISRIFFPWEKRLLR